MAHNNSPIITPEIQPFVAETDTKATIYERWTLREKLWKENEIGWKTHQTQMQEELSRARRMK